MGVGNNLTGGHLTNFWSDPGPWKGRGQDRLAWGWGSMWSLCHCPPPAWRELPAVQNSWQFPLGTRPLSGQEETSWTAPAPRPIKAWGWEEHTELPLPPPCKEHMQDRGREQETLCAPPAPRPIKTWGRGSGRASVGQICPLGRPDPAHGGPFAQPWSKRNGGWMNLLYFSLNKVR